MMRPFIFLFSLSLCMNSCPVDSSVYFNQGWQYNESVIYENLLKVSIFYYRDFPYRHGYLNQQIKGCIKIPEEGIVRCKELIALIRPGSKVNNWLRIQHEKGYLPLTLKEFGVTKVQGHINKVMPAGFSSFNKQTDGAGSRYVPATGIFMRHALDVKKYTFKNVKTNVIFSVQATREHPVYSVSRQAFVPVSKLLPEDKLLSENGQKIQLLCRQGVKNGCGVSFNQGRISVVYNIEVSQRHTYFIQGEKMLVHNDCKKVAETNGAGVDKGRVQGPVDTVSNEYADPEMSVSLVVMDDEGIIQEEDPSSQRFALSSLAEYTRNGTLSRSVDGSYVSPSTDNVIYGIADHKKNVVHFDYINNVLLDSKGELKTIKFSLKDIKYSLDDFKERGYRDKNYLGKVITGGVYAGLFTGLFFSFGGVVALDTCVFSYESDDL